MNAKLQTLALISLLVWTGLVQAREKSVIVGFKQRPGAREKTLIQAAGGRVTRSYRLIPALAASLHEDQIQRLKGERAIAYVEESAIYRTAATPVPTEEYEMSWGVRRISSDKAHASGNRGAGVRIAVLDTGIDYTHEDLVAAYRGGHDFVFDDADPFDDSFNGHGTHMAGIIAAGENSAGIVGVAPEADLYAVKVLDGAGFGSEEWVIAGIDWAVANGVDVINLSVEGPDRQGLRHACDMARAAGVLLVAAGGNSLLGGGSVAYPAAYDSVIAVTATDRTDRAGSFAPTGEDLTLAAPGVDIYSTVSGGGYGTLSGTSQAAAHVSGVAALFLLSDTDDLNEDGLVDHEDVRLKMLLTAIDLGSLGSDDPVYGHGLVNAGAAAFDIAVPQVVIDEATADQETADGATVTIHGRGFGGYAEGSITSVAGTVTTDEGESVTAVARVVLWSNATIVARFVSRPADVTVNSVFGTATLNVAETMSGWFRRGDANADGVVDVADPVYGLTYLIMGGPALICPDASDADDDGRLEITDALVILNWLFLGRADMPSPGPEICGPDPTDDALPVCEEDLAKC